MRSMSLESVVRVSVWKRETWEVATRTASSFPPPLDLVCEAGWVEVLLLVDIVALARMICTDERLGADCSVMLLRVELTHFSVM